MRDGQLAAGTARRLWLAAAAVAAVGLMVALPAVACTPSAQISVRPDEAAAGATVNMSGTHFDPAGGPVEVKWGGASGTLLATVPVAENSTFTQEVTIPAEASPGFSSLTATQQAGDTTWHAHFAFSVAGEEPADEPAEQEEPSNGEEGAPEGGTAPDPAPEPDGEAAPEPAPEPDGEAAPEPAPEPDGAAAPEPVPEPEGAPAPDPAPEPDGATTPDSGGEPAPEPAPQPQSQTAPDSQPAAASPSGPQPAPRAAGTAPDAESAAEPVVSAGSGSVAMFPREMLDARGEGPAVATGDAAPFDSPAVPQEIRDAQGEPAGAPSADRADAGTESSGAAEEPEAAPASRPDVGPSPWFLLPLGLLALGTLAMGLGTLAHELKRGTAKAKM